MDKYLKNQVIMKSFANFFREAVETLASTEAKNRGLVGNGHGDWYDNQGNFVAKTVNGKLKFYGQGDSKSVDGIPGEEEKVSANYQNQAQQQPQEQEPKGVVVVVGRFNPPSKNHEQLLKAGFSQAKRRGFEYRIYPSRIQDSSSNPLNPTLKIAYMKSMFPDYEEYIVDSEDARTIFDIEVESPGSSALMKAAVAMGDFYKFEAGLPINMDQREKEEMFNTLRKSMKVNESTEAWRIEPEFDYDGLRWNYKNNNLFEVGTFVENVNSGLIGKIIRRGANYLICVTEDNLMFKSWLRDVREVHEIGTLEYLNYVQGITPGEKVHNFSASKKKKSHISRKNYK